ncbi:MAG: (4-(4-[2-(gamma-L-glutamylamino)ethyl]phenoxymethyl)furan-2-yl)methanamine synthase [Candidatus Argoarchaeum ethanivorans]|uniref:(4-(4-[2-(Gamma-L-glutamylamino)ethyl]phenoxymethyl)furan-2-yl)methanamine synthase n=1 Tax=Candidatus Argoarchaeum ethanivorans TaxID=2608793 RepID=A0A8B3S6T0_9EURY|nr:MAG: (4-(4-[2-(gamma-L-glutamylamino)ethyl]phenoxymethyl)furan-2-yl)methanamine synthase [Candidatus Argoarchaeum ethanivorans]
MILGIDIGGANTKIASSDGTVAETYYLPLWKSAELNKKLTLVAQRYHPSDVVVVMTGELADSFCDKKSGVQYIKKAVEDAFATTRVTYIDVSGKLTDGCNESTLAASNWCASVRFFADEFENCIFADMGTTTTDIIPIVSGTPVAHTTDLKRLLHNQLVYTGLFRTNIAALTNHVYLRDMKCKLASEYFANTADIHLILGHITESSYTCETPDGGGKDLLSAKRRLARIVCADFEELADEEIYNMAEQIYKIQVEQITRSLEKIAQEYELNQIVVCGIGEFVLGQAALNAGLEATFISERYGKKISGVFPAYAAAKLNRKII